MTGQEIIAMAEKSLPTLRHSDPLYEDMLSEAVLALLEGRDPAQAAMQFRMTEIAWRVWTRGIHTSPHPDRLELVLEH